MPGNSFNFPDSVVKVKIDAAEQWAATAIAAEWIEHELHAALAKRSDLKPEEETDFLVRLLAQSQSEAAFERTYYLIFGSQIAALRELNARGGRATLKRRIFTKSSNREIPSSTRDMDLMDGTPFS